MIKAQTVKAQFESCRNDLQATDIKFQQNQNELLLLKSQMSEYKKINQELIELKPEYLHVTRQLHTSQQDYNELMTKHKALQIKHSDAPAPSELHTLQVNPITPITRKLSTLFSRFL